MKKLVLFMLTFFCAAGAAEAGEPPRYDVAGYCARVGDAVGGSAAIEAACFGQEQAAYNGLKARWNDVPAKTRAYCDRVGAAVGGSYAIVASCIEQESAAAADAREFEY